MSLTVYISDISFFTYISDISVVYLEQVSHSWVAFFVSFAQKFTPHNAWEMSSTYFQWLHRYYDTKHFIFIRHFQLVYSKGSMCRKIMSLKTLLKNEISWFGGVFTSTNFYKTFIFIKLLQFKFACTIYRDMQ